MIVIKTSQKIVIETTFPVGILPLTNPVIIKLNEITTFVQDKSKLTEVEVVEIKKIFKELVKMEKDTMWMKLNFGLKMKELGKLKNLE